MTLATTTNFSPNMTAGRPGQVILIGIHTMEAPETGTTAEAVADYFKRSSTQASAHWCVDNNSRVRCVRDDDTAWAMPPVNEISLNIELAGTAGQTKAQWADTYSLAVLDNASLCVAEWCSKFGIPVRRLSYSQISKKEKGIVGQADVNAVYGDSDHWDPGPNFPWDDFLGKVSVQLSHIGGLPPSRPDCTSLQAAIRTGIDNLWGQDTDKHATALIEATAFGGKSFPYGILFAQGVVGTLQDGVWGPKSEAAISRTVLAAQKALLEMKFDPKGLDSIWGPNTDRAYRAARTACHI